MAVAWFFAPYKRKDGHLPGRYCAMDDFTPQILADPEYAGGEPWAECEMLGNYAVVKVRASSTLLSTINAASGFVRIPARFTDLNQTLGDLTTNERTQLLNFLQARGYTLTEIQNALGSTNGQWRTKTLRQVLRFALTRRLQPRYDAGTDTIVLDGPELPVRDLDEAAGRVA